MAEKKRTSARKKANKKRKRANIGSRALKFCELIASGHNGTEAARGAGYSVKCAAGQSTRLLDRKDIQAKITELRQAATAKVMNTEMGKQIVARQTTSIAHTDETERLRATQAERLMEIGFGDIRSVVNWDEYGNVWFTPSDALSPGQAALISGVTKTIKRQGDVETCEMKLTTNSNLTALRDLAKLLGLNEPEKREHSGKVQHVGAHVHFYTPDNGRGPGHGGS